MQTRQELRQDFYRKRKALSKNDQYQAALQLTKIVAESSCFQQSQKIAFYQAVRGEIDPLSLLQLASEQGKHCYLPLLNPIQNNQLCFSHYQIGEKLIANRYKILEPEYQPEKIILPAELELVLVPLVAFDSKGNRLGSGAGYYDRTFNFLLSAQSPTKPFLLGIAYAWQKLEELPIEPWDVPLNAVATDTEYRLIKL